MQLIQNYKQISKKVEGFKHLIVHTHSWLFVLTSDIWKAQSNLNQFLHEFTFNWIHTIFHALINV